MSAGYYSELGPGYKISHFNSMVNPDDILRRCQKQGTGFYRPLIIIRPVFKSGHSLHIPFKHFLKPCLVWRHFQVGLLEYFWHLIKGGIFKTFKKSRDKSIPFIGSGSYDYFIRNRRMPYGDLH